MITLDSLTIRFNKFTAVDNLSLDIKQGELFGFLGPNGAGKTTTIKALNGALTPTSGKISVLGHALPKQFNKVKPLIAYVPDTENHYDDMSGHENLALYAKLYGLNLNVVDFWLAKLQLTEAAHVKAGNYSKGMKKKLLIARELMHQPKLVFFDEPTANLDAHSVQLVRSIIQELSANGTTIFLTTHDMEEVEQICDRVAIIAKGKLLECDTPTAFITRHAERFCDVQYDRDGIMYRHSFQLDDPNQRIALANIVQQEHCVRLHSREFKFEDVFKKLTGEAYT